MDWTVRAEGTPAGQRRFQGNRQAREEWLVGAMREGYSEEQRQLIITAMGLLDGLAT